MKKRTIWTKLGDFLEGRGFYIVLALCIVAIGGSGYYLYRMISLSDQLANQSVSALATFSTNKLSYNRALEDWRAHTGMDISAQVGDIVASACDGTVIAVQENVMLGQTVTIQTADKLKVTYGNLAAQVPVKAGDTVKAGQTIGNVGKTAAGEAHDKAWIHLAVEKDGKAVDPKPYLKAKK